MQLIFLYLGAAAAYYSYAWITYNESFKSGPYFIPVGLTLALVGNLLWMLIARGLDKPNHLFVAGVGFDVIVTSSFILTPFLFFGFKITPMASVGLLVAVIGLIILKVSLSAH